MRRELPPLTAIVIVIAVSAAAFAGELAVADHLPWGAEARGVIAVLLGAITALWLTVRHGGSLADIGLTRPRRWWTVPFWVLGILVAFGTAQALVPQLLAPYFDLAPPDMSRYDFIRGNATAAITFVLLLPLTAAIPEEIVYRGFLVRQFERLYGNGPAAPPDRSPVPGTDLRFGALPMGPRRSRYDNDHGPGVGYRVPLVRPQPLDSDPGSLGRTHRAGLAALCRSCCGIG